MKTRLPITTVSYNTEPFLITKLEELRKAKIITTWFFIHHLAEEDEKKDHIHLYIRPAKDIQTDNLLDEFLELDMEHPDKPLKCLSFRVCRSFGDWYLYVKHDPAYLLKKGQTRRYQYDRDAFVSCDEDELDYAISEIDMTDYTAMGRIVQGVKDGLTFEQFAMQGNVPVQQFTNFQRAWDAIARSATYRNGRNSHTPNEE